MVGKITVEKYEEFYRITKTSARGWPNKGALICEKEIKLLKNFGFEINFESDFKRHS